MIGWILYIITHDCLTVYYMRLNLLCGASRVCGSSNEQGKSYVLFLNTVVLVLTVLWAKSVSADLMMLSETSSKFWCFCLTVQAFKKGLYFLCFGEFG